MLTYLNSLLSNLTKSEKGQDLAEYALLLALIAIIVIVAVVALGPQISSVFSQITACLPGGCP